jgi:hypothetical protein
MPASLARAACVLGAAAAASGFLPGLWKWASLGAMVVVVLVAIWIRDNLVAEGAVQGGKQEHF